MTGPLVAFCWVALALLGGVGGLALVLGIKGGGL